MLCKLFSTIFEQTIAEGLYRQAGGCEYPYGLFFVLYIICTKSDLPIDFVEKSIIRVSVPEKGKAKDKRPELTDHRLVAFLERSGYDVLVLAAVLREFLIFYKEPENVEDTFATIEEWHRTAAIEDFMNVLVK